jgi:hypothetical protein
MIKNLIISPTGENSLVKEWVKENPNFDLVLLCYNNDEKKASIFKQYTPHVYVGVGEKWHLIKSFIENNLDFIKNYDYIWCPDDDVSISTENINKVFDIAKEYNLQICQPSMKGYVAHDIIKPISGNILRYTNFVEILAPLFNLNTLLTLYHTFNYNISGWGYEWLWAHLLNNPQDKIAIIDSIVMEHTKPLGGGYTINRFPIPPLEEMQILLQKYKLTQNYINYQSILQ